jgi:hypothetical protein
MNVILTSFLFLLFRPKPVVIFWCLFVVGYWHTTVHSSVTHSPVVIHSSPSVVLFPGQFLHYFLVRHYASSVIYRSDFMVIYRSSSLGGCEVSGHWRQEMLNTPNYHFERPGQVHLSTRHCSVKVLLHLQSTIKMNGLLKVWYKRAKPLNATHATYGTNCGGKKALDTDLRRIVRQKKVGEGGTGIAGASNDNTVGRVRGVTTRHGSIFEGYDTTINAFIWFLGLRTKSQYAQGIAQCTGAHNRSLTDQIQ